MVEKIRTLGPGSLKIGATNTAKDFSADTTNVTLEPKADNEDNDVFLDGHTEGGSQTETWTLSGTIKEDYSTTGIQVWALQNTGKTMPFEWVPNTNGKLKLTGNLVVASIPFGGDVKSRNGVDFSFNVVDVTATAYTTA